MRIAFINAFDDRGGAARAAFRLFAGVYGQPGVTARFFSRENETGHPGVTADRSRLTVLFGDKAAFYDQKGLKRRHPDRVRVPFSVNRIPDTVHETVAAWKPDLVHLHWPHAGFLRLESLAALGVPVVWTLHDMWAFTGVCHYAGDCAGYLSGCGSCPLLRSATRSDVSARVFARKKALYPGLDLHPVCPSAWLAGLARVSPLLRDAPAAVIPNGLYTEIFAPMDREEARASLGLPQGRRLVLFGADAALDDPRKGGRALVEAFAAAASKRAPGASLVVFGDRAGDGGGAPSDWPGVIRLGPIRDDRALARLYAACDLFAFPSNQDNLPNTVMEALSCGTPVLACAVGGVPEMIEHGDTGWLTPPGDMGVFLEALFLALESSDLGRFGENARKQAVARYGEPGVVSRHMKLYRTVLEGGGKGAAALTGPKEEA